MKTYHASAGLERYLLAHAPAHIAVDEGAPQSLAELKAAAAKGGPLPVWSGGSEHTIYSTPEVNFAFRAWHDTFHLLLNAEFNGEGEAIVNAASIRQALEDKSVSIEDLQALHYDVWGQYVYATHHAGEFPTNQAAFIAACFDNFDAAVRATY